MYQLQVFFNCMLSFTNLAVFAALLHIYKEKTSHFHIQYSSNGSDARMRLKAVASYLVTHAHFSTHISYGIRMICVTSGLGGLNQTERKYFNTIQLYFLLRCKLYDTHETGA